MFYITDDQGVLLGIPALLPTWYMIRRYVMVPLSQYTRNTFQTRHRLHYSFRHNTKQTTTPLITSLPQATFLPIENGLIYTGSFCGRDQSSRLDRLTFEEQARNVLTHLSTALARVESCFDFLLKLNVYILDKCDISSSLSTFHSIFEEFFLTKQRPVINVIATPQLSFQYALIQVDAVSCAKIVSDPTISIHSSPDKSPLFLDSQKELQKYQKYVETRWDSVFDPEELDRLEADDRASEHPSIYLQKTQIRLQLPKFDEIILTQKAMIKYIYLNVKTSDHSGEKEEIIHIGDNYDKTQFAHATIHIPSGNTYTSQCLGILPHNLPNSALAYPASFYPCAIDHPTKTLTARQIYANSRNNFITTDTNHIHNELNVNQVGNTKSKLLLNRKYKVFLNQFRSVLLHDLHNFTDNNKNIKDKDDKDDKDQQKSHIILTNVSEFDDTNAITINNHSSVVAEGVIPLKATNNEKKEIIEVVPKLDKNDHFHPIPFDDVDIIKPESDSQLPQSSSTTLSKQNSGGNIINIFFKRFFAGISAFSTYFIPKSQDLTYISPFTSDMALYDAKNTTNDLYSTKKGECSENTSEITQNIAMDDELEQIVAIIEDGLNQPKNLEQIDENHISSFLSYPTQDYSHPWFNNYIRTQMYDMGYLSSHFLPRSQNDQDFTNQNIPSHIINIDLLRANPHDLPPEKLHALQKYQNILQKVTFEYNSAYIQSFYAVLQLLAIFAKSALNPFTGVVKLTVHTRSLKYIPILRHVLSKLWPKPPYSGHYNSPHHTSPSSFSDYNDNSHELYTLSIIPVTYLPVPNALLSLEAHGIQHNLNRNYLFQYVFSNPVKYFNSINNMLYYAYRFTFYPDEANFNNIVLMPIHIQRYIEKYKKNFSFVKNKTLLLTNIDDNDDTAQQDYYNNASSTKKSKKNTKGIDGYAKFNYSELARAGHYTADLIEILVSSDVKPINSPTPPVRKIDEDLLSLRVPDPQSDQNGDTLERPTGNVFSPVATIYAFLSFLNNTRKMIYITGAEQEEEELRCKQFTIGGIPESEEGSGTFSSELKRSIKTTSVIEVPRVLYNHSDDVRHIMSENQALLKQQELITKLHHEKTTEAGGSEHVQREIDFIAPGVPVVKEIVVKNHTNRLKPPENANIKIESTELVQGPTPMMALPNSNDPITSFSDSLQSRMDSCERHIPDEIMHLDIEHWYFKHLITYNQRHTPLIHEYIYTPIYNNPLFIYDKELQILEQKDLRPIVKTKKKAVRYSKIAKRYFSEEYDDSGSYDSAHVSKDDSNSESDELQNEEDAWVRPTFEKRKFVLTLKELQYKTQYTQAYSSQYNFTEKDAIDVQMGEHAISRNQPLLTTKQLFNLQYLTQNLPYYAGSNYIKLPIEQKTFLEMLNPFSNENSKSHAFYNNNCNVYCYRYDKPHYKYNDITFDDIFGATSDNIHSISLSKSLNPTNFTISNERDEIDELDSFDTLIDKAVDDGPFSNRKKTHQNVEDGDDPAHNTKVKAFLNRVVKLSAKEMAKSAAKGKKGTHSNQLKKDEQYESHQDSSGTSCETNNQFIPIANTEKRQSKKNQKISTIPKRPPIIDYTKLWTVPIHIDPYEIPNITASQPSTQDHENITEKQTSTIYDSSYGIPCIPFKAIVINDKIQYCVKYGHLITDRWFSGVLQGRTGLTPGMIHSSSFTGNNYYHVLGNMLQFLKQVKHHVTPVKITFITLPHNYHECLRFMRWFDVFRNDPLLFALDRGGDIEESPFPDARGTIPPKPLGYNFYSSQYCFGLYKKGQLPVVTTYCVHELPNGALYQIDIVASFR